MKLEQQMLRYAHALAMIVSPKCQLAGSIRMRRRRTSVPPKTNFRRPQSLEAV